MDSPDSLHDSRMSRPKRQTDGDGRLTEAFRTERLEDLRKQVSDGTYHVSERSVAAAMVKQGWSIIGRARPQG
jgi:anti-sigma28 factor (negative regulator of flagellin synthesis)